MPWLMQLLLSWQCGVGVQPMSQLLQAAMIFTTFVPAPADITV
jgi:hypothetical protein